MKFFRLWIESQLVKPEHRSLPVTQIYCWLWTRDKKIALVSKNGKEWQLPGGHPKEGESILETLRRELQEELSLDIGRVSQVPKLFGYYVIEERERGVLKRRYVQMRTFLLLEDRSDVFEIQPQEDPREKEEDKIRFVCWCNLSRAKELIPWLAASEELKSFLKLVS